MSRPSFVAYAHAKINLDLRVGGTRADGYHELSTVFQSLALHDEIELCTYDGPFRLTCDTSDIPADATNLVWRAAAMLAAAADRSLDGLTITLRKRVPAQSGLGGASADAAATLRLLAAWWGLAAEAPVLARAAAELGADVPFFLVGGTALGTGRGDLIQPLPDLPEHHVLVLVPPFGISTSDAYGWFDEMVAQRPSKASPEPPRAQQDADMWRATDAPVDSSVRWHRLLPRFRNDLEPVVTARHPEVATAVSTLRAAAAVLATMSGSGSAVVGLFQAEVDADRAAVSVQAIFDRDDWCMLRTRTISRDAYGRSLRPQSRGAS